MPGMAAIILQLRPSCMIFLRFDQAFDLEVNVDLSPYLSCAADVIQFMGAAKVICCCVANFYVFVEGNTGRTGSKGGPTEGAGWGAGGGGHAGELELKEIEAR